MKTYKELIKAMRKNKDQIKELENKIEAAYMLDERREASKAGNTAELKRLREESQKAAADVGAMSDKINDLKLTNNILRDNVHAAMYEEIIPQLIELFKPYEGKSYGPATRDKIYNAARARGFSFYLDGFLTKDILNIYLLNEEGYTLHFDNEKTTEIRKYNREPFLNSENKIQFAAALENTANPYKYTENIKQAVKDIKKQYKKYKQAAETARAAQDELNKILPSNMRFDKIDNTKYMTLI